MKLKAFKIPHKQKGVYHVKAVKLAREGVKSLPLINPNKGVSMIRKLLNKIFHKKNHVEIAEMKKKDIEILNSLIIAIRSSEVEHEAAIRRRANAAYRQQVVDAEIAEMIND